MNNCACQPLMCKAPGAAGCKIADGPVGTPAPFIPPASIAAANRSTGNNQEAPIAHSLARTRVLDLDPSTKGLTMVERPVCALCHVGTATEGHWCPSCALSLRVQSSGAAMSNDAPPADWSALALWCVVSAGVAALGAVALRWLA